MATRTWIGGGSTTTSWSVAGNWLEGSVPVNGDDVYIYNYNGTIYNIDTGLNQSAVALTSLTIDKSYTGTIGTASAYLQVGTTTATIGAAPAQGSPAGASRINLDVGSSTATINILDTASTSADSGYPPVRLKGSAITSINVTGGLVGLATIPGETSTVTTLRVSRGDGIVASTVFLGPGVTVTNAYANGGTVSDQSAQSTTKVDMSGGTYNRKGNGAITTVNANGGIFTSLGTGTVTTLNIGGGTVDFTKDNRAKTVTTINMTAGSLMLDTGVPASVTITNGVQLAVGIKLSDVDIQTWKGVKAVLS